MIFLKAMTVLSCPITWENEFGLYLLAKAISRNLLERFLLFHN